MTFIDRLHQLVFNRSPLDDFERAIINKVMEAISDEEKEILTSQLSLKNSVYRDFDEEKGKITTHLYWQFFGRTRRDFPKRFTSHPREFKWVTMKVEHGIGYTVEVSIWTVSGVIFVIEFEGDVDHYYPQTPDFKIYDLTVNSSSTML